MAGEIQLNSVSLATESGGTVTLNSSTDIKGCINASGSAPIYACRAWINFDGQSASIGTGRANGNVSGVTDNGTGDYTVEYATAMPDGKYSAVASCSFNGLYTSRTAGPIVINTDNVRIATQNYASVSSDVEIVTVAVFR